MIVNEHISSLCDSTTHFTNIQVGIHTHARIQRKKLPHKGPPDQGTNTHTPLEMPSLNILPKDTGIEPPSSTIYLLSLSKLDKDCPWAHKPPPADPEVHNMWYTSTHVKETHYTQVQLSANTLGGWEGLHCGAKAAGCSASLNADWMSADVYMDPLLWEIGRGYT